MTTKITIEPAGHTIKVTQVHTMEDGSKKLTDLTLLEPNSQPSVVYIHSHMSVMISEVSSTAVE